MPEYIVTDPQSGRKIRLTGDSPPTDAELEQIFANLPPAQSQQRRGGRDDMAAYQDPETAGMSRGELMQREALGGKETGILYGMAKPFLGAAQLGMKAGEAVFGEPEGGSLAGRMASALERFESARSEAGGSNIPVMGGQALTGMGATAGIAPAAGFIGRAAQGIGIGAATGAVEPVTSEGSFGAQKTAQVASGAIAGGATSLLGSLGTALIRRMTRGGAEIEAGRVANTLAGDRQEDVINALRAAPAGVTAAQAAAPARSAEFSALGRRVAQVRPSEYEDIAQAQNAARARELGSIAGTADDIAAAERARSAATAPLYRAAEAAQVPVDAQRTVRLVERIMDSRRGRPQVTSVLNGVKETLLESYPAQQRAKDSWDAIREVVSSYGTPPRELVTARRILNNVKNFDMDPYTAIAQLQSLKPTDQVARDAIRSAISNLELPEQVITQNARQLINASRNISDLLEQRDPAGRKVNQALSRELLAIKRSLDQQIAKAAPEFGEAQKLFADLSKPIDRMRVGQYIQERLIPAINDAGADAPQRATVFANAMRDMNESVRQATGFRRGGWIADLMTPDEMQTLNRIGADLARDVDVQRMARAGGRRVTEEIGDLFGEQAPNALSRPLMIINAILRRTGTGASERTMSALAEKMQDPAAMADIMEKATRAERRQIERGIMLYLTNGAVSSPDDAVSWAQRTAGQYIQREGDR